MVTPKSGVLASIGRVLAMFLFAGTVMAPATAHAGRLPSRAEDNAAASREADLKMVRDAAAQSEVQAALAAQGLSPGETQQRLAQLSAEDLRTLAANTDQIRAAGRVPNYIWWLLAALIAVTIITTIA